MYVKYVKYYSLGHKKKKSPHTENLAKKEVSLSWLGFVSIGEKKFAKKFFIRQFFVLFVKLGGFCPIFLPHLYEALVFNEFERLGGFCL